MTPTIEQLNEWALQALDWSRYGHADEADGNMGYLNTNGKYKNLRYDDFTPATDLSQAWREFVLLLFVQDKYAVITKSSKGNVYAYISNDNDPEQSIEVVGYGLSGDAQAAYALTYAFVQAMNPQGYIDFIKEQA